MKLLALFVFLSCAITTINHDSSGKHYKSLASFLKSVKAYQIFSGSDSEVAEISEKLTDKLTIGKSKTIKGQYVHLYSFLPGVTSKKTLTVFSETSSGNVLFIPQVVLIDGKAGKVVKVETKGRIRQGSLFTGPRYFVELDYRFKKKRPYFFIVTSNPKFARTKKLEADYISQFMEEDIIGAGVGKYSIYID